VPSQTALEFIKSAAPRVGSAAKSQSAVNPSVNADSPQETLHEASRETALLVARFEDMLKRHEARIHDCHCRCGLARARAKGTPTCTRPLRTPRSPAAWLLAEERARAIDCTH
jgi:hypothetical protein